MQHIYFCRFYESGVRECKKKRENTRFMWFSLTAYVHREKEESLDNYMFTIISIYLVKMNPKWVYIGKES